MEGHLRFLTPHDQTHDSEDNTVVIASASSESNTGTSPIMIWKWNAKAKGARTGNSTARTFLGILELSIRCVIICGAVAYFVGILREKVGHFRSKNGNMIRVHDRK
jgi:hypothetical protein